jgi:hypothetical protein
MSQKTPKDVSSIGDRIRGSIAFILCVASFTGGCWTNDNQWLVAFLVAGFLFMLTTVAYVFDKFDPSDPNQSN